MNKMRPDVDGREIIREFFSKILELEKGANYVVPFERYMKKISLMDIIARNKIPISLLRWDTIDKSIRKLIQAFCYLKE